MVEGLSHMTLIVKDLDKMERFLTAILDARKINYRSEGTFSISRERFFDIAGHWIAIMEGEQLTPQTYNHVAFKTFDDDYGEYLERIWPMGLELREGRPRVEGEGRSIYFHDFDNHLFELHTETLDDRLERYAKA